MKARIKGNRGISSLIGLRGVSDLLIWLSVRPGHETT